MAADATYGGALAAPAIYPDLASYNLSNTTQADAATYDVSLPASGTWVLWGRLYYPGTTAQPKNDPNSFWVSIDGSPARVLGNRTDRDHGWHWDGAAGSPLSLGTVSAGRHTLKIWNREARESAGDKLSPRLDVLLLSNDPAYVPNDADVEL